MFSGLCLVGAESVAVAGDGEHHAFVQEPVEHGRGNGVIGEDLSPRGHSEVGGEDDRSFSVSAGDDLE